MTTPTPLEVKMALLKMTQLLDEERALHAKTRAERDQARQMLADAEKKIASMELDESLREEDERFADPL